MLLLNQYQTKYIYNCGQTGTSVKITKKFLYSNKKLVYMVINSSELPSHLSRKDAASTEGMTQSSVL